MPKINMQCKSCNTKYTTGDFLPPSKSKCPKCGTTGNQPDYKESLKCEICGIKVESRNDLTEYDGLLVDDGYDCCDSCTEKLESIIKDAIKQIRDQKFRNR